MTRTLQPLERVSTTTPVVPADQPWEDLLAYVAVHRVATPAGGEELRMWYQSYSEPSGVVVCYATSTDGVTWHKPALGLVPFPDTNSSKANNIVLRGDAALYFGDVLYEPDDPDPSKVFKMVLFDRRAVPGIAAAVPGMWLAFSSDGLHWDRPDVKAGPALVAAYGGSPVTPPPFSDQDQDDFRSGAIGGQWLGPLATSDVINVFKDPKSGAYWAVHKTWIDGIDGNQFWKRAVALSTSADFQDWSTHRELLLYPDEHDDITTSYLPGVGNVGTELHGGPTFYHAEADVYVMMLEHLNWRSSPTGDLKCELALARGAGRGPDWRRPFRQHEGHPFFLDVNPAGPGKFDSGTLWMSAWPVRTAAASNETLFYYGAYSSWDAATASGRRSGAQRNGASRRRASKQASSWDAATASGIGAARMVRDRFAYLAQVNASYPAQVTTRPRSFDGVCRVTANVDTETSGVERSGTEQADVGRAGTTRANGGGTVTIEILDARGYRMRGFSQATATVIPADVNDVAAPVTWKGGATVDKLPKAADGYSLRIHVTGGAKVYAVSLVGC
eukprot:g125.t1